ncbi:MAG TPA: adenosine deaminase [Thermoanaerobaculia bacterium]|nr:adenosine deaminase [Thermoanaerobaculia bacterium]
MSLERFVLAMPKVELHLHLEGAMRPGVLFDLARRNRVELPAADEAGLQDWFRFRDFPHFVDVYLTCSRCLAAPEDFKLLAADVLAEQARQNVVYTEAHFTISTHIGNGADGEAVRAALEEAVVEAERAAGVTLRFIPDIVRNVGLVSADRTLEWALGDRTGRVAAIGLAGIEKGFPNEPFREHFEAARRAGLGVVAHAGEHGGPDSIRSTLDVAAPDRLDHGVRAVEDPDLLADLVRSRIPLDVCPSSNVCLGVVPDLASHPFDRLRRAGANVNVNTDDPPFFDTDLTTEYLRLAQTFGYGAADLAGLSLAALRAAFLPVERKAEMEREFRRQFAALGEEHLGAAVEPSPS